MSLDIADALRTGWERTTADNGLIMVGLFFAASMFSAVIGSGVATRTGQHGMWWGMGMMQPYPISLPLPVGVLFLLGLAVGLVSVVLTVAAIRVFASDEREEVPQSFFTEEIGWRVLNLVVGAIVYGIIVAIGLVFLIVPGIYLMVALLFWSVIIAVEGTSFVEALQRSWAVTKGNRLGLFGLGILVVIITAVVNAVFSIPAVAGVPLSFALVLSEVGSAFTAVYTLAVLTAAYQQLG